MIGSREEPGIIPLMMEELTRTIQNTRHATLEVSFLEVWQATYIFCNDLTDPLSTVFKVYCEMVKDLLCEAENPSPLDVREDPKIGVVVTGLTWMTVHSAADLLSHLHAGNARRTTRSTNSNETSSR